MKTRFIERSAPVGASSKGKRGHTLVEMMMAMGVFAFVVIACVYVNLFVMLQDEVTESELGASDAARTGLNQLSLDIRSAKLFAIGNYSSGTFTTNAANTSLVGNALLLNLTTNLNECVLYYFQTSAAQLWRTSAVSPSTMIVEYLTNTMQFSAENYAGTVQSAPSYKSVIHAVLQFAQYKYPLTPVGSNCYYNSYEMDLRYTPHVPDGT
jgi:hypothetical protein